MFYTIQWNEVLQIESGPENKDNPLKNIFSNKFREIANKIIIKDKKSILNEIKNNNINHNFNDFCMEKNDQYTDAVTKNSLTLPNINTKYSKLYISKEFINKYLNEISKTGNYKDIKLGKTGENINKGLGILK
ncbi:hypothetical protein U3516DRAFT_769773 [Neocallimastix sp. 'constans']